MAETTQIQTECACCQRSMWFNERLFVQGLEPLCTTCLIDMRDDGVREDDEQWLADEGRGSRCTPGCGWCGACS